MELINHGESSGGLSVPPAKRRRGRPPKDPSLKHTEASHTRPVFGARAHKSAGLESMVGKTVTGVIESTFDAGYFLNVRIGHSNMILRGVVFKPGHCAPITAENDVAPHLPMIRRNEFHFPAPNPGQSHGQKFGTQTTAIVPAKRKYTPRRPAASIPPTSGNGSLVPVVLQAANIPSVTHASSSGDEDVHMVEPLSMIPPDQSIPVGHIFGPIQSHSNNQIAPGSRARSQGNDSSKDRTSEEEKTKPMMPSDIDTPGSSQTSDTKTEDGKEMAKSSPEDLGITSKLQLGNTSELFPTESLQATPVMKPLFSYGTGRMTELLQAVQENMKETPVQIVEQPSFVAGVGVGVEYCEPTTEFDPKNHVSSCSNS